MFAVSVECVLSGGRLCTFYTHSGGVPVDACGTVAEARLWPVHWGRGLFCAGLRVADGMLMNASVLSASICREVVRARAA